MKLQYLVIPVVFASLIFVPALAQSPIGDPHPWPTEMGARTEAVRSLVSHYAEVHNVSPARQKFIIAIMRCENRELDPLLQSRIIQKDGTREESYGLAQIHLPSHPITKEEATDPYYAIEFIVRNVAEGRENMWTCARMLKERESS